MQDAISVFVYGSVILIRIGNTNHDRRVTHRLTRGDGGFNAGLPFCLYLSPQG
jgi:hypothetical protein